MVDVGDKPVTRRVAIAEGLIRMDPKTLALVEQGGHKKGDVLGIARIAGIMGAKRTADLVPLCHPLALTRVEIELAVAAHGVGDLLPGDGRDHRPDRCGDGGPVRRTGQPLDGL